MSIYTITLVPDYRRPIGKDDSSRDDMGTTAEDLCGGLVCEIGPQKQIPASNKDTPPGRPVKMRHGFHHVIEGERIHF
jgi:hypothetical protein